MELRALFVEDSAFDATLVLAHIRKNFNIHHSVVDSEPTLRAALAKDWDIVICDYNLPGFDALKAISIIRSVNQHLPVIIVSGSVGEECAVLTMRAGASDFVLKDNLSRLIPAIERGLKDQVFHKESQQVEATLRKAEEDLRQAQKLEAIGQLAGGIAHDFNNIIATILMQVETLLEEADEDLPPSERIGQLEVGLGRIRDAGERAKNLTRQLLGFSRKQILQPKVVNLNLLVTSMESMLRPIVEENIIFQHCLAENLKNIKADPSHIEQILLNLVVNSRDAMPQGGTLTVSTSNAELSAQVAGRYGVGAGPYALLEVIDTGSGITPEAQKRLFEPFFTTKPVGKGTGLGLSTVYGIVKQNRGLIFVESELGSGTKFQIYFPQVEEEVAQVSKPAVSQATLTGTETILFVEDEASLKEIICKVLVKHGYRVLMAANGIEALDVLKKQAPEIDLVITDVVMPQMGGADLALECQSLKGDMKFLFQSGHTENTLIDNGIQSGHIHFLEKPYSSKTLLAKVRSILG